MATTTATTTILPSQNNTHSPPPSRLSSSSSSPCYNAHTVLNPQSTSLQNHQSVSSSPLSETATSQLPNLPGTGIIWAELANLAISAFTDPLVARLRAFIECTPQFTSTHLNMLGPIVVRHVAHMLDDLNNNNSDPHSSSPPPLYPSSSQLHGTKRRPRSLFTSSLSSSLSVDTDQRVEEHGRIRRGPSYRHLAYQAVRLNKILPESFSAQPHPTHGSSQIVRKLSITTPTPGNSQPVSPQNVSSSSSSSYSPAKTSHDAPKGLGNNSNKTLIPNELPMSLPRTVLLQSASDSNRSQPCGSVPDPSNTRVDTRPRYRHTTTACQQGVGVGPTQAHNHSKTNNNFGKPPRPQPRRPQSLHIPNARHSRNHGRCVVMDFRQNAQHLKDNDAAQSALSSPTFVPVKEVTIDDINARQHLQRPAPAPNSHIDQRRDDTQHVQMIQTCLSKTSTKSSSRSTDAGFDDEYEYDELDNVDDDVENITNNIRNVVYSSKQHHCYHSQPQPTPQPQEQGTGFVGARWRTQPGRPDPSKSLPRAGVDAILLSHSARNLRRYGRHFPQLQVVEGHGDRGRQEEEDPPSSHDTSIEEHQEHISEPDNHHIVSRLVLLRRQRERRRTSLRV